MQEPLKNGNALPSASHPPLTAATPSQPESEQIKSQSTVFFPREKCIHEWFQAQAERTPEATALVFENRYFSYRELNERANQLAHHLRKLGVKPEMLVGLFIDRSLDLVVGLLGILKAGGAYVPMDPQYPQERLAFMMKDAGAAIVVTQKKLAQNHPIPEARLICLDIEWPDIASEPKNNPANVTQPDNLAYVIYTSGSTGSPKGSLISHYNVVRLFQATEPWFHFNQNDVWTLFHSSAFDFSVWELWGALFYGGRLVIVSFQTSRSPENFHRLLREEAVTVLNQTPSAFRHLIQADELAGFRHNLSLRLVIFGGEALDFPSLKPWFDRHGDLQPQLVNMYGITETTVHVTYRPIFKSDMSGGSVIGVPIPDLQIHLLDEHRQPVTLGAIGEICVGGTGVGRGYLNRPELTAKKFIPNPFSSNKKELLYCSGDLGRYLPNGDLLYLGRLDGQVKVRGFRIELGEIESGLNRVPGIRESAVVARPNAAGEPVLVAYVVAADTLPTVAELRSQLLAHLPDYMVPGVFVPLPALPLTAHGKVDRQALPAPDQHRLASGTAFVAPRTAAETKLAALWRELLNLPQVGIHDNFFALGGHSLLAVRMVNEIKHRMSFDLPIRLMFQHPTVQELAKILPAQKNAERKPELLQLQPGTAGPELFFLIDEGSLGLLKLAHFLDKDLRLYASIVPIPETTLRAASRKNFAALPLMEEWAAKHVALIRSHPTNGPVRLAGHCFGGMLAFEVARQLQAAGIPVEAVLLLDTWMTMPTFWGEKKAWLQEHVGKLLKQGPQYLWSKSRRRIVLEKKELVSRIDLAVRDDFDLQIPWIIIARIYRHAMDHYRPKPLASRGILFISEDDWMSNAFRPKDNTLGASRVFTDGVEVVDVPGNHVTVLNEMHLPKLAEHYNRHLKTIG